MKVGDRRPGNGGGPFFAAESRLAEQSRAVEQNSLGFKVKK